MGRLDLEALLLVRPLVLEACFFDEAVRFDEARAPRVELKGCWVPALSARQFETRGDLTLDGLTGAQEVVLAGARIGGVLALRHARLENGQRVVVDGDRLDVHIEMDCSYLQATGEVNLLGAHVGGQLSFEGARLSNEGAPALSADGLQVDRGMFCRAVDGHPFEATGELRLAGAHVGGELSFEGARLSNENAPVLSADRLQVDQSMFCRAVDGQRFEATGELRLAGAHVAGQLSFEGARLSNEGAPALSADGLQVDQGMFCVAVDGQRFEATGELRLAGAHVAGQLSFEGARLSNEGAPALTADGLQVDQDMVCRAVDGQRFEATGELRLAGAHVAGQLSFEGARLSNEGAPALSADGLQVDQDMFCVAVDGQRFEATGELRLAGAHVGGVLSFGGARLSNEGAPALSADGLQVDQGMFCLAVDGQRFEATGELRLAGAHVGGQLSFEGARLSNEGAPALSADGLQVDQSMVCRAVDGQRFEATGELRLAGAHVGGQLSFEGARLSNEGAPALSADGLQVDQGMFCVAVDGQRFEATGELRLAGAHVGGVLSFGGARLSNEQGLALDLESVEALELSLPGGHPTDSMVDLTDAVVGQFHDGWRPAQAGGSSHQYPLRLSGFVYQSLGPGSDHCEARLDWLRYAADGYVPQGYDQLAAVFRRAGREEDARRVAIAKQRRRRSDLPVAAKTASYLLDVAVGYGYRTWRAVYALLAIVLIGWGVFAAAFPEHLRATRPAGQLPPFHPWLYSIDAVLPVINLGQESAWTPTGAAQIWYAFSVLAGWVLGLGFVAYFTAKLFRE